MDDISLQPRRFVWQALTAATSSKQIAWGIAWGVLMGFIPKGNLIAVLLAAVIFALPVNLLAALIAAVVCSFVGVLLDPFFDHMGRTILTIVPLQGFYARVYQWPLVPWTAFNNTVVMGSLFVGLLQLYPTYRVARRLARRSNTAWDAIEEEQAPRLVLGTEAS